MEATIGLPELDNPEKYRCVPHVAILDQDTRSDDPLTQDFLLSVLTETNNRIQGGDFVLLTIGHTDDELPEIDQPPLVGYAKNLVMGELNGKAAILADLYIDVDRFDEVMTYPRRSIELWHDEYETGFIDIVSFLRRAPARSLGLLTYKKYGQRTIYSCPKLGDEMTSEEMEKLADILAAKLSLLKFEADDKEDKIDMDKEDDEVDKKKKKSKKAKDENGDEVDEEKEEYDEDMMDDDQYDASCASSDNTFTPGVVEEKKAKKMRRDSARIRLSQLESQLGQVIEERDRYKLMLLRSERERDLKQLEAEGYQFDSVEELAHVGQLDATAYATHISRARKNYKRIPVGKALIQTDEPRVGTSKEEINEIVKFASKNNVDFATALSTYKKSEVK